MALTLDKQTLNYILYGATFLGSGGGGPLAAGQQIIEQVLGYPNLPVLVTGDEVDDNAKMALSAFIGSPNAASSDPIDFGQVAKTAYDELNSQISPREKFTHVLGAEPGAGNTFIPIAVAALNQIPVIDATGASRAVPTIPLCTFASANLPISPIVLANPEHHMTLFLENADQADPALRGIISNNPAFGSMGGLALWGMDGATMKKTALLGTVSHALQLGQFIQERAMKSSNPVAEIVNYTGGYLLGRGKLTAVNEISSGGFDFISLVVDLGTSELYIYGENENIFAFNTKIPAPIGMGPDSLCWVTAEGMPFSNSEAGEYLGKEVALVGLSAPSSFRIPFIIQHFQDVMRQLGYAGPYTPIETLAASL